MKNLIILLCSMSFFLPAAKGQGEVRRTAEDSTSNVMHYGGQIRFGHKIDGTVYMVDGVIVDTTKVELIPQTWLNTNTLLTKIYTEKNFQYTNLEYFISTLPQLRQ